MRARRILIAAIAGCLTATAVFAAGSASDLKKSAEMLEKHYYDSAAALLRTTRFEGDLEPMAALTLARAYARSAELHRALHVASLALGTRYLQQLTMQRGPEGSRYAALFHGEYLIEARRSKDGATQIRRFLEQKGNPVSYTEIAKALLAAEQGTVLPAHMTSIDPLVRLQAAATASKVPARRADALALTDQSVEALRNAKSILPMRAVSLAVGIYARLGEFDKAFTLLAGVDRGRPSIEEKVSESKVLRHYDPALLGNIALLHVGAAEAIFERVRNAPRVKSVAGYFLAELHVLNGRASNAAALIAQIVDAPDLPPAFRERAAILQAIVDLQAKDAERGKGALDELAKKHAENPVLLAETLLACVRARQECVAVTAAARRLAQSAQSERFRALHRAVGEQYAAEGKHDLALQSLETARDKSNKNKLDTNDPLLLLRLAEQHFAAKSFSESLEIYFELGKEFPAVRQLQEAAQGIYSTEYRSAGDVRIF